MPEAISAIEPVRLPLVIINSLYYCYQNVPRCLFFFAWWFIIQYICDTLQSIHSGLRWSTAKYSFWTEINPRSIFGSHFFGIASIVVLSNFPFSFIPSNESTHLPFSIILSLDSKKYNSQTGLYLVEINTNSLITYFEEEKTMELYEHVEESYMQIAIKKLTIYQNGTLCKHSKQKYQCMTKDK